MKNLMIVAEFTIKDMIQRKSFIISMIIILLLIVVGFNVPNIINSFSGNDDEISEKILLIDDKNVYEGTLETLNKLELGTNFEVLTKDISLDDIKQRLDNGEIDSCIKISKVDNQINLEYIVSSMSTFGEGPTGVVDTLSALYENVQISKLGLTEEQIIELKPAFDLTVTQTDENAASGNIVVIMLLSIVLFYAIYFCAYQVSSSITTEKTSRIMETLITSTKPRTIVLGKTIGIGIVGLIQVLSIIIVAVISAKLFLSEELLASVLDMSNITPMLAITTLVYFILGYSLYSLLYALTGSTVSKPEDINSANSPIAMLAMVGFYLAYFSMMNPGSNIDVFASILPISAPFSMPFRIMMGTATAGQIAASILILVVFILLIAKIAIKIYSSAILNYGSKVTLKEMLKIAKYKND